MDRGVREIGGHFAQSGKKDDTKGVRHILCAFFLKLRNYK